MLIWILPVFPSVSLDVLIYYRVQGVLQIMTRHLTLLLLMRLCFLMSEAREDILLPGGWKGPGFRPLKDMEERFLARRLGVLYCTVLYCGVLYLARRSAIWRPDTRGVLSGTMRLMEAQSTAYTLCFCA